MVVELFEYINSSRINSSCKKSFAVCGGRYRERERGREAYRERGTENEVQRAGYSEIRRQTHQLETLSRRWEESYMCQSYGQSYMAAYMAAQIAGLTGLCAPATSVGRCRKWSRSCSGGPASTVIRRRAGDSNLNFLYLRNSRFCAPAK